MLLMANSYIVADIARRLSENSGRSEDESD